jgi:DNA polymerase I-like protein with 3'-5' exonuclease and polymerase domains
MSTIVLDIESFYDKTFSLSKLTTESYIRSPLFETIGFAYSIDGAPATWVTGTEAVISAALHELDLHEHTVICHNAAFDGAILAWRYGIIPKTLLCTMAMAKPIHGHTKVGGSLAKLVQYYELGVKGTEVVDALGKRRRDFDMSVLHQYGQYCKNDVMLTWALFNKLLPFTTKKELYIIDMLLKMYVDPVLEFDKPLLETHLGLVQAKKKALMDRLDAIGRAELMSNPKFAGILEKLGVVPPKKVSPATGKEAYAFAKTDAAFKALLEHEDVRVQTVVAARLGIKSTLEETRTESFIGIAERGKLPVMLQYYGAATGRCSGGDKVNFQNLPRGGALRKAITAPAGHVIVVADSSQIEARIVAWLAGQTDLVHAFATKQDVYKRMASILYGKPIEDIDKGERQVGKVVVLGAGYGMSATKFRDFAKMAAGVELSELEAKRIITTYREANSNIADLWKDGDRALKAMAANTLYEFGTAKLECNSEGIVLPNKMLLRYPGLSLDTERNYQYDSKYGSKKIYGAMVVENVTQALARIVVFDQMCRMNQELKARDTPAQRYRTVLSVHDETVLVVPEHDADWALQTLMGHMNTPPAWALDLPVACEGGVGTNYGDSKN